MTAIMLILYSMRLLVDVLDMAIGRKVCILGNMYELGENEKNLHYDVGQYIGTKNIDVLITIGDLARHTLWEQTIIWKHILVI